VDVELCLAYFETRVAFKQTIPGERKAWYSTASPIFAQVTKIRKSFEAASRGQNFNNQSGQQHLNQGQHNNQKKGGGKKQQKKGGMNKQLLNLQKQIKDLKKNRPKLTQQQKAERYKDILCHGCGQKGHVKRMCPNKDTRPTGTSA